MEFWNEMTREWTKSHSGINTHVMWIEGSPISFRPHMEKSNSNGKQRFFFLLVFDSAFFYSQSFEYETFNSFPSRYNSFMWNFCLSKVGVFD